MTYQINRKGDRESIKCLKCGAESHSLNDVAHKFCSRCNIFHETGEGYILVEGFRLDMVSLVSAPKCGACNSVMTPADRMHWKCPYSGCDYYDKPIHTGSYPIELAKKET